MNNMKANGNRSNILSLEGINIEETECIVTETKKREQLLDSKVEMKKRKNRRGRRETYCPYYKLSDSQRHVREEKERMRIVKLRKQMRAKGRIIAPYNTTQFIMADQQENSFEYPSTFENENHLNFDSSQSNDNFMKKEFMKEYDIQKLNSLDKMNKEKLLREFMILERKNESLEAKLQDVQEKDKIEKKEMFSKKDTFISAHISTFLQEIKSLSDENKRLTNENVCIKQKIQNTASSASSSSSSSCSSSSSSESSDE
jgi:hypothetical protein